MTFLKQTLWHTRLPKTTGLQENVRDVILRSRPVNVSAQVPQHLWNSNHLLITDAKPKVCPDDGTYLDLTFVELLFFLTEIPELLRH